MAKVRTRARCRSCGHLEPRWMGRCPACGIWGSLEQEVAEPSKAQGVSRAQPQQPARSIVDIPATADARMPSRIGELDRVLGGGFVAGSVTLLGGEPGAGKSTLLLQVAKALAAAGRSVLYVSAEESTGQVRLRGERLGALEKHLLLASELELPAIVSLVEDCKPDLFILDSIQAIHDPDTAGGAGGVAQVRECAAALVGVAKQRMIATVLVGHVTKEGQLAGPRLLEHMVDTVCEFEGDRHHDLRLLRAVKNRFGPVGEVGCFEMTDRGLHSVADAGRLFLSESAGRVPGVATTLVLEGRRPLACEVQALVAPSKLTNPRRVASGLDASRLHVLTAVLHRRLRVPLSESDIYVSSVGGVRISEPAADLALALAIASSHGDFSLPAGIIAIGEIGLAGEVRQVARTGERLEEAKRLGFSAALVPAGWGGAAPLKLRRVRSLEEALRGADLVVR